MTSVNSIKVRGAYAEFYRVSKDDEWIYFNEGQAVPSCEDYKIKDEKNAFAGTKCFSNTHDKFDIVKP